MASAKEIRIKIKSIENTRKITKAMEMVAASKMRRSQERMRASRPYREKVHDMVAHLSAANPEYRHPYMSAPTQSAKAIGLVLVSSDKGLCGGLNNNLFRLLTQQLRQWHNEGTRVVCFAIGQKAVNFSRRIGLDVVAQLSGLGNAPDIARLLPPFKSLLSAYSASELDGLFIAYNGFINTMKQDPRVEPLLPLPDEHFNSKPSGASWDYLYEPSAEGVIAALLDRYLEAMLYQAVAENMASEQSARMVAMKAASDNAKQFISNLTLLYNKERQASITRELSEIVAGAAAV